MEIIGIIAEYNPLHNGHIYHINKIKEKYPNSLIILALNGYFMERGEVSILSKYDKAYLSVLCGVDIVISIPTLFGVQSADTFAHTAVKLLNYLNVNKIIFGSESNNIELLTKIAKKSLENDKNEMISYYMKKGLNYPTALSKVINEKFDYNPNDLLGICYIKSILQNNYKIIPETILRTNNYLDTKSNDNIISALNIRNKIKDNENINKYVPENVINKINIINNDLLFNLIKIQILNNDISNILDVDEDMMFLLQKNILKVNNLNDLINKLKSKKCTYNKINRLLIHILLNIKKDDAKTQLDYINIIGFNKKGKNYLNSIKKNINISTKINKESIIYKYELKSAIIYDMVTNKNELKKELENKPIIL